MNHFSEPLPDSLAVRVPFLESLHQKRISFGLFKIDIINYIEEFFKIEHIETKSDDYVKKSVYRILHTDINMIIASYIKDHTIQSFYLCTFESGFTYANQKSLLIDFNITKHTYDIRDISVSDYRTPLLTKDEVFKALSNYFNATCLDIMRDKKLKKLF